MFDKVLIANRGEIALRVIRACKKLGYATVAVYSEADRGALHVAEADEAVAIGPAPAAQSYLVIEKLVRAALDTGCGAIHPGYGFLSESAAFARAVQAAGLVFIGPDPEAIAAMGNKSNAKALMLEAGVPCVPGYHCNAQANEQEDAFLAAQALKIGLPVMVKAAAGGGGRGMRLVHDEAQLATAIASARSEAANAFGDGQLLIEKAVLNARHVEIQVFGDRHGNVVHIGERDCSVQRRHQKVVEECPSPAVDDVLRMRMGAAAVAAARAVRYVGAGTVEFMLAEDGQFYFLEMNTRLQVEHPVTEIVYDLDLVEWQLRVAQGEALPLAQDAILARRKGWAIEVRLCTEDPARGFLPQTGTLLAWRPPTGPRMRVDHGLREGGVIAPDYDSMQAKLIASGGDREQACRTLLRMLDETVLLGVASNRDFLRQVVAHPAFASGRFSTDFIAEHFPAGQLVTTLAGDTVHRALAALLFYRQDADALAQGGGLDRELIEWQSSAPAAVPVRIRYGDSMMKASVRPCGGERYEVQSEEGCVTLALARDGTVAPVVRFVHDGVAQTAHVAKAGATLWLSCRGATCTYEDVTLAPAARSDAASDGRVLAPMDGKLIAVLVAAGDAVTKGQPLAVLEAMKMEFAVTSQVNGAVDTLACKLGQQVKARQLLMTVRDEASGAATAG
ncbi:MAG TPA: biotin carboxylase N-terminal domain-containing protein [Burkholderiaceae bacterium]|nr:biotin carboxylase N-terminal domain-containing protein [Burkholderiaceae bacterium]